MSARLSEGMRLREKATRLVGMGCTGLLIAVLAVLAAALLLRALVALFEVLAVLVLASVTAMLLFVREWPEGWSQQVKALWSAGLIWLNTQAREQAADPAQTADPSGSPACPGVDKAAAS